MVRAAVLLNLCQHLSRLGQFRLEERVGFEEFISLALGEFKLGSELVIAADLGLSLLHLLGAFFAELIVMSPKKGHLLE